MYKSTNIAIGDSLGKLRWVPLTRTFLSCRCSMPLRHSEKLNHKAWFWYRYNGRDTKSLTIHQGQCGDTEWSFGTKSIWEMSSLHDQNDGAVSCSLHLLFMESRLWSEKGTLKRFCATSIGYGTEIWSASLSASDANSTSPNLHPKHDALWRWREHVMTHFGNFEQPFLFYTSCSQLDFLFFQFSGEIQFKA